MKTGSKIALGIAAVAALLFARKKSISGIGKINYETYDFILSQSEKWRNDMLDRMLYECERWLTYAYVWGYDMAENTYHLFAGNPREQIHVMRIIRRTLGNKARVSEEQIDDVASRLGVSGIGKVLESDYDSALITTKDGRHAVGFEVDRDGTITATAYMKGDGSRYGFSWEFWYHIGYYKTLKGAISAVKRSLKMHGYEISDTDLNKI